MAMLGFPVAVLDELSSGESLLAQLSPTHLPIVFAAFVLFVAASVVPIVKEDQDESFGPFNPKVSRCGWRACKADCMCACTAGTLQQVPPRAQPSSHGWVRCSRSHRHPPPAPCSYCPAQCSFIVCAACSGTQSCSLRDAADTACMYRGRTHPALSPLVIMCVS